MRRRWATGLLVSLLLASACGTTVQGTATEDPTVVATQMFATAAAAVQDNLSHIDGRYTAYVYMRMGSAQLGNESGISIRGDDPAVLEVRQSKLDPTLKVTIYHPAASSQDLLKLDGKFTTLAPTPWVSYPTFFPSKNTITCSYPALSTLCNVERAREATEKVGPPGLLHDARVVTDGGVELHSGATLKSLLDEKAIFVDDEASKTITAQMMQTVVPVKIVLDTDKNLRSIEVIGEIPGKPDPLAIQVGFERRGPASENDFPAMPKPEEVTAIPDEQGRAQLWQRIHS